VVSISFAAKLLFLTHAQIIKPILNHFLVFAPLSRSVPANPAPGFEDVWNTMFPQAAGNTGTCTAQGFFNYIGVTAGYLFTGCIAVSSLLQVRFRFSKKRMRFAEYFFFGVSIAFPLLTSVFILVDQGFNPNPLGYCTLYTNLSIDGVIDRGINTQRRTYTKTIITAQNVFHACH